jgi:hypothetical protein
METTTVTKKAKLKYVLCKIISILLTIMPLLVYIVIGFENGDIHKGQKVFLGFTCIMAIMLTMFNILFKYKLRSPLFILLLGIYYAINNILTLIIIICVGIVLDEFIFTPLAKKYKEKYTINKEIDERL